jgi:hypothetical protein
MSLGRDAHADRWRSSISAWGARWSARARRATRSAGDALGHLRTSLSLTEAAPAGDLTATIAMLTQRLELADVEAQLQQPAAARATLAGGLAAGGAGHSMMRYRFSRCPVYAVVGPAEVGSGLP